MSAANLGRIITGAQRECRESIRDALAMVVLPGVAGATQWLGGEDEPISTYLPIDYSGPPFAYHPNVRSVNLRLSVRRNRISLEGIIEPDDILRLQFLARTIPVVAHYGDLVALVGSFWEATNIKAGRELTARKAGHVQDLPTLSGPISEEALVTILGGRHADIALAVRKFYLDPDPQESIAYCKHVLGIMDLLLATWLPKAGDTGRPPGPQSVPEAVLAALCSAFPVSGFGGLLEGREPVVTGHRNRSESAQKRKRR